MSRARAALQRLLLSTYNTANRTGLLDTALAERVFQHSYFAYKRLIEDPFARLIKARPAVLAHGDVIDVGANIGYTATLFARGIEAPYRVHAFEPEERNFRWLEHAIARANLTDRVVANRAAVGSQDGAIDLWHNAAHHADHRIATDQLRASVADGAPTQRVPITTIDTYISRGGWQPVSFIKIDVQGFEPEVLHGMGETIRRNPEIHVAVELMPSALEELGFDPAQFLRELAVALPRAGVLQRDGSLRTASYDTILTTATHSELGYVDLVCAL
ncbi:MAG TPA: FkbM family methyltransferase [Kofleriaceae bacterium]|nr:FkbM family methyltransferase [Kofleriaceae bacterium]